MNSLPNGSRADDQQAPEPQPRRSRRRMVPAMLAVVILLLVVIVWMMTGDGSQKQSCDTMDSILLAGCASAAASLIVAIRGLSAGEILELAGDVLAGILAAMGAVLGAVWSWLRGLVGLD